jgi:hypothetical protein
MKTFSTLILTCGLLLLFGGARLWAESEGKLVSQWTLANFSDGEVKNKIPAGGPLTVWSSDTTPSVAEEVGVKGLRFGEGEALIGKSKELPLLGGFGEAGQPFSVRLVIVPLGKVPGAYGGLFEAMVYNKCGFRLVTSANKLGVEAYSGESGKGFSGKTALSFGTVYTVEVKFDGTKVTLLLDGEIDGEMEMGLPDPFSGEFRIGKTSGFDYYFNGIIGEVSIFALKP